VPVQYRSARAKSEIALAELDRLTAAGVRFGAVLADAGYGMSAEFRQALSARGLAWAVGIRATRRSTRATSKDCQESCVRGHSDAGGGRIWRSRRTPWISFWRARPERGFQRGRLFDELKKALAERVLNAEIDDHLDGEAASGKANHRNGYSKKTC